MTDLLDTATPTAEAKAAPTSEAKATYEGLKNLSESVKNVALTLGVLIGGAWTAIEFNALLRVESSKAGLELQQAQTDHKKAEAAALWAGYGAPLNLALVNEKILSDGAARFLVIEVEIENPGARGATLDITDQPLRISKASTGTGNGSVNQGKISWVDKIKLRGQKEMADGQGPLSSVSHISMLPGQKKTIPFIIEIRSAGIYLIEFRAHLGTHEQEYWQKFGMPPDRITNWSASKFVEIK